MAISVIFVAPFLAVFIAIIYILVSYRHSVKTRFEKAFIAILRLVIVCVALICVCHVINTVRTPKASYVSDKVISFEDSNYIIINHVMHYEYDREPVGILQENYDNEFLVFFSDVFFPFRIYDIYEDSDAVSLILVKGLMSEIVYMKMNN